MDRKNPDNQSPNHIPCMPIGMCMGLSIGVAIGSAMDNIGPGMCIGLGIGMCLGAALDSARRNQGEEIFPGGNPAVIEKWLEAFGKDADPAVIKAHVTAESNYLWHLFTWGKVSCLAGDEAREAFDRLQYSEAIFFCDGYSNRISGLRKVEKMTAEEVDADPGRDVYLVAKDFSWTYVRTHERDLGPYLCFRK